MRLRCTRWHLSNCQTGLLSLHAGMTGPSNRQPDQDKAMSMLAIGTQALAKQASGCDPAPMIRLSKRTNQAVRLLVHLAQRDDRTVMSVPDLSKASGITGPNGFKIVPILVQGGFLKTEKGRGGGVLLAMQPCHIRVGDVVKFVETFGNNPVIGPIDPFLDVDAAFDAFVDVLNQNSIADLAVTAKRPANDQGMLEG
ncbi:MAG: Rrf2 family transcriptional regulator [Pseudomonadota bacterium]